MQPKAVRAFKNRLRNYNYDLSRIKEINEDIEMCYYKLGGVKGIDPSKEPTHAQMDKEIEYKIRDDIERLEALKRSYEDNIKFVDSVLELIDEETRGAIKKVFINGDREINVAQSLFMSLTTLHDRMDYKIKIAVSKKESII